MTPEMGDLLIAGGVVSAPAACKGEVPDTQDTRRILTWRGNDKRRAAILQRDAVAVKGAGVAN